jgi:hypothetical protein
VIAGHQKYLEARTILRNLMGQQNFGQKILWKKNDNAWLGRNEKQPHKTSSSHTKNERDEEQTSSHFLSLNSKKQQQKHSPPLITCLEKKVSLFTMVRG